MEYPKGTVLVVEQDTTLLDKMTNVLSKAGYFVMGATAPLGAVINLNLVQCNVALLDMDMQQSEDDHSVQLLKSLLNGMPVVLMTGLNNAQELAASLGMCDWLGKPFETDELIRVVEDCVERNPL